MKDMQSDPRGPHLYLLSQDGYENLQRLQDMLTLMAHITYNEDNADNGNAVMTIGRAELYFIFQSIIVQIDEVLDRLAEENCFAAQSTRRQ